MAIKNLLAKFSKRSKKSLYVVTLIFLSISACFLYNNETKYKFFYKQQNLTILFNYTFTNPQTNSIGSCVLDISNKTGNFRF